MTPSSTKVIVAHVIGAKATSVVSAKTSDVIPANSSDVIGTKSTHVTSFKAPHVGSAKATPHVASTTTSAAAGLGTRSNKAAGKQCTCQNHHRSSSHNILQLVGRLSAAGPCLTLAHFSEVNANVAMYWRWELLLVLSTKFCFNQPTHARHWRQADVLA
jgi:hypothetical protein